MIRKYLAVLATLGLGLLLGSGGNAAEPATAPAAPAAPAPATPAAAPPGGGPAAVSQVAPKGPPIVIEAGKGTLIRLSRPASTVFIANPDIADVQVKSPELIYVTAKAAGQTVLYAVDASDQVLLNAPVHVEHDLSQVRQMLGAVAPNGDVKVSSVGNSVVLSGKVESAGEAEKVRRMATSIQKQSGGGKGDVVNRLSVATPNQVNIRVRVAEVNRSVLKSIGVNWQKLAGNIQFATGNPVIGDQITSRNILATTFGGNNATTTAILDALAQEGYVTTLAEPNLTATNGQPASFLAGGEFPVPVAGAAATAGGATTITVEFKKFGVALDVTPTIIDAEHLTMRIRTEVSQLSTAGAVSLPITSSATITIPALTERTADTTVELGSGQSFLLGGLLQNTLTQNISKVPGLGDIPILGQLFRSERFEKGETELVIVVTPYLVRPTLTSQATPVDGFSPPHDMQRIINGDLYRRGLPRPERGPLGAGGQSLVGQVGFRLD